MRVSQTIPVPFDWERLTQCRLYWWPLQPPPTDGGEYKMGLNTSNVNPEVLRFVDRKYGYSWVKQPLQSKETAHQDDLAEY
jgi:hypothetical protein